MKIQNKNVVKRKQRVVFLMFCNRDWVARKRVQKLSLINTKGVNCFDVAALLSKPEFSCINIVVSYVQFLELD